jgi:hypothetical protein
MIFLLRISGLVLLLYSGWVSTAESKPMFLCDEGTSVLLTDREDVGCPAYVPEADLITVPDGATWADVEWAVALKVAERPSPGKQRADMARMDPCALWMDLNFRTEGGLDMKTSEQTRRWLALSRIVTATNICEEYFQRSLYPRF